MHAIPFLGREAELAFLNRQLEQVRTRGRGMMLTLRGRRQVGKSRLVEEFISNSGVRGVFHTATQQPSQRELEQFSYAIASLSDRSAAVAAPGPLSSWEAAFALLANEASGDSPTVIVLDEFPYLVHSEPALEAILQAVWDRQLEKLPVLLILIGSDVSMMESLSEYGRPLWGRFREKVIEPLSPAAIAKLVQAGPADAFDAYLVTGGFPRLAELWTPGDSLWEVVEEQLADASSPLLMVGEQILASEFPADLHTRSVLEAIGSGERTFTAISKRSGVSTSSLDTILHSLTTDKRVIAKLTPYSARVSARLTHYYVADPYLRFWLRFLGPNANLVARGRGDLLLATIKDQSWTQYRGLAIEPIVRASIERLLPQPESFGDAQFVGSYWTRNSEAEIDLVGGREPTSSQVIDFIGSIKWREQKEFSGSDTKALAAARDVVPGATSQTGLVGVSRSGFSTDGLDVQLGPTELLEAWTVGSKGKDREVEGGER